MSAAIQGQQLFRIYSTPEGNAAALQGLDLTVEDGETLVVLGPSGSGKTTLLRLLAALDRPSAGTLRVFASELPKLSARRVADYRASTIGYVEQHYAQSLSPELNALQLVALRLALQGVSRRERDRRARELLERIRLGDRGSAYPAELSGGEQQRIAVAAALAHRPRLLLADEPTGELDAANAALVYELIGDLARDQSCTTVIVSHDPESATIADRVVQIRDGRVSDETVRARDWDGAVVVGRGGWLRLPEELLLRAGIRSRAMVQLQDRGVLLAPVEAAEREQIASPSTGSAEPPEPPSGDGVVAAASSLAKTFGSGPRATTVFSELSASFRSGRFATVTGRSGLGKTTLLHLLGGLERPTAGKVIVCGTALSGLSRDALAALRRKHIALVRQEPGLIPFLTARENVELALSLRGLANPEVGERAIEALAAVGLAERSGQRISRLSAGERQRAAIARALAARPALLLADEPTARLDQANALAIANLLARLAREFGTAVVCATHDPLVIEQADEELRLGEPSRTAISVTEVTGSR